jgi:hypothetical protein
MMAKQQLRTVLVFVLIGHAYSANDLSDIMNANTNDLSIQAMAKVFYRSAKVHQESIASLSSSLTLEKSIDVLKNHSKLPPALAQVTNMMLGKGNLLKQPKGYSGVDGARHLLNDMIYEAMKKYDQEIAKCTDYYSRQCAAMEVCRGTIAAANYIAANSRALILDAQSNINRCQVEIPEKKYELKQHILKCKAELYKLNTRLKIVLGDIAVMTMILEMTDCDKTFMQGHHMSLLHCIDPCTKKPFVTFDHEGLQKRVSQLKSAFSTGLMNDAFADLFDGIESM